MMHQIQRQLAYICLILAALAVTAAADAVSTSGHETLACDSCHLRTVGAEGGPRVDGRSCLRCHELERDVAKLAGAFHAAGGGDCTACHSFHRPDELKVGEGRFVHEFGVEAVDRHCATCHGPSRSLDRLSEGHRAAAAIYHGNDETLARLSPSETCLLCHSRHDADARALQAVDAPPRFNEHASHPYGARVALGTSSGGFRIRRDVDKRLTLFDGRMECQTCHDITDDAENLLVRFDTPTGLCQGCHQRTVGNETRVAAAEAPRRFDAVASRGLSD
jgi:predicted CXXCH cytochrome family protein